MNIGRTNTILYCDKWVETVTFYRDILKFPINHQKDWFIEFRLASHTYLSVADANRASIDSVGGQGITLSWQVDDLHQMRDYLQYQQVTTSPIKTIWGALSFYVHDPEGHRIEFWMSPES